MPLREIARTLNDKNIPSPYVTKSIKRRLKGSPIWHPSVITKILDQSAYWGEYRHFKTANLERISGKKDAPRRKTSLDEQVIVPVPVIVTKELAEAAHKKREQNKEQASRNNPCKEDTLLRAGLAICGYCGGKMRVHRDRRWKEVHISYTCARAERTLKMRCQGSCAPAQSVDQEAREHVVEVIRNPSLVDEMVKKYKTEDPTANRRKKITKKIAALEEERTALEENLATLLTKRKVNQRTVDFLNGRLQAITDEEEECKGELANEEHVHEKWKKLQTRLDEFHERCQEWRKNIDDPEFNPSYKFWRDACEFFGITAIVWKEDHKPPYKTESRPPSIVSLLSSSAGVVSSAPSA